MSADGRPWEDTARAPEERARALVSVMSTKQKIAQLHGNMETIDIYSIDIAEEGIADQLEVKRHAAALDELGMPRMRVTNGPVGVGMGDGPESPPATSLPMTIGVAAGFDPELAADYSDIIGSETATYGQHVLEGPGLGLHRLPPGGRNFEYCSEDPYLTGVMGVAVTKAIQAHDVIAMAKHYVVNDQEHERFRTSVASIMSAYNRIRGVYATEYRYTLTDILRTEWGFTGYVQSDFWSTRSAAAPLHAGPDLEMPDAKWLNEENLTAAVGDASLEIEAVDRALVRRFTQMFRFGQFERPYARGSVDAQAHQRRRGGPTAVRPGPRRGAGRGPDALGARRPRRRDLAHHRTGRPCLAGRSRTTAGVHGRHLLRRHTRRHRINERRMTRAWCRTSPHRWDIVLGVLLHSGPLAVGDRAAASPSGWDGVMLLLVGRMHVRKEPVPAG